MPSPAVSRLSLFSACLAEAALLAAMLVVPLLMNVSSSRIFEADKLALLRTLSVIVLAALAVIAAEGAKEAAARLTGWLKQPIVLAVLAWTACVLFALCFSPAPLLSVLGEYTRRQGVLAWFCYVLAFAGILGFVRERQQIDRIVDAVLLASVVPALYALQQCFQLDALNPGLARERPTSTLGNPIFLGAYLIMVAPLTLSRLIDSLRQQAARPGKGKSWPEVLGWGLLACLQFAAIAASQSRGPLLGMAAGMLLYLVLVSGVLHARRLLYATAGLSGMALLLLAVLAYQPEMLGSLRDFFVLSRFAGLGDVESASNWRLQIWGIGLAALTEGGIWRWLTGFGLDTAYLAYYPHINTEAAKAFGNYQYLLDRLHNETLETLLAVGIPGLLSELALFATVLHYVLQKLGLIVARMHSLWYLLALGLGVAAGSTISLRHVMLLPLGLSLGLAAGGIVFAAVQVWRRMRAAESAPPADALQLVLAAIAAALVGSWVELQFGIPTTATRLHLFAFAALALVAGEWRAQPSLTATAQPEPQPARKVKARPRTAIGVVSKSDASNARITGCMAGLVLIITSFDLFPPRLGLNTLGPALSGLGLVVWLFIASALFGLALALRRTGAIETHNAFAAFSAYLPAGFLPWLLFAAVYAALPGQFPGSPRIADAYVLLLHASVLALVLLLAALLYLKSAHAGQAWTRPRKLSVTAAALGICLTAAAFVFDSNDTRADVQAKLGDVVRDQGQFSAAIAFYKQAIELQPYQARYAYLYAAAIPSLMLQELTASDLSDMAQLDTLRHRASAAAAEADAALARAARIAPGDPRIVYLRANIHRILALGDYYRSGSESGQRKHETELAQRYFDEALRINPGNLTIAFDLAMLHLDQRAFDRAATAIDAVIKRDPKFAPSYLFRAQLYEQTGQPTLALAEYDKATAADPKDPRPLKSKATLLAAMRRPADAIQAYASALILDPDDYETKFNLALLHSQRGELQEATAMARRAIGRASIGDRYRLQSIIDTAEKK